MELQEGQVEYKKQVSGVVMRGDTVKNLEYFEESIERLEDAIDEGDLARAIRGVHVCAFHYGTISYASELAHLDEVKEKNRELRDRFVKARERLEELVEG